MIATQVQRLTPAQAANASGLLARLDRGDRVLSRFAFYNVYTNEQRALCIQKLREDLMTKYRPVFRPAVLVATE